MGRVVILGGGYAGINCFWALRSALGAGLADGSHSVTLVSRDPYHTYHGWTTEVLSGRLAAGRTLTALDAVAGKHFMQATASSLDLDRRVVHVVAADGSGHELPFDHLLLATGSRDPFARLPGLAEHGWRLKDTHDMQALAARLDAIEAGAVPMPAKVAVIGGGMAGVETASAIADRLGGDRVVLLASGVYLLPGLLPRYGKIAANAADTLRRQGVQVRLSTRVAAILPDSVELQDGTSLASDLTVAAAGIAFDILPGSESLVRTSGGQIPGDRFLRAGGADGVWVAGDMAEVMFPGKAGTCPVDALWAMKQGRQAGINIARAMQGKPLKPFAFKGMGQAAGLADREGISELFGMQFTGRLAWFLRATFFAWYMPSKRHGFTVLGHLLGRRRAPERPGNPEVAREA